DPRGSGCRRTAPAPSSRWTPPRRTSWRRELADSAHHELGDLAQRITLRAVGETGEGRDRIVMECQGLRPRALDAAGGADDRQELAHLAFVLAGRDDARRQATVVSLLDRVDHRQRRHALGQIAPDGLPEIDLVTGDVQDV